MHALRWTKVRIGVGGRAGLLVLLATAAAAQTAPLRYALEPGNQLVYERRVQVESAADGRTLHRYTEQLRIWVLQRRQSKLLLIAESLRAEGDRAGPARGVVFQVDYRGRPEIADEVLPVAWRVRPVFALLPVLPPAFDAGREWESPPDLFGRRWRCHRRGPDPARSGAERIDFETAGLTAGGTGGGFRGTFWFDTGTGRVVRLESQRLDPAGGRRIRAVVRLFEERQMSPEWCRRRVAEAEKYLYTLRLEQRLRDRIGQEPQRIAALLGGLDRIWAERLREMPAALHSPLRKWARDRRRWLQQEADVFRARARVAVRWRSTAVSLAAASRPAAAKAEAADRYLVVGYWRGDGADSIAALQTLRKIRGTLPAGRFEVACVLVGGGAPGGTGPADLPVVHLADGGGALPAETLPAFRILAADGRTVRVYFGVQPALARKLRALAE